MPGGTKRRAFWVIFRVVLISAILTIFRLSLVEAAAGINQVIPFQGKVVNSNGTNVTDGTYDFVFKLYDGAGSTATTLWTESWTAAALWSSTMSSAPASGGESLTYATDTNESTIKVGQLITNTTKKEAVVARAVNTTTNVIDISPTRQAWATTDTVTNKIYVKDGIFSVQLNSLNASWTGVDFNTDTIFIGINFNADGEMKPRIQFGAAPYALNAAKVAGLTVTNTTGTLTIANSKTLTANNSLTFSGSDGTTFTFPGSSDTVVALDATQTLTNKTLTSPTIQGTVGAGTGLTMPAFTAGGAITGAGLTIYGNSTSAGNLTLSSTSHATKGKILFGTSGYDEANNRLGIGNSAPDATLHLTPALAAALKIAPYGAAAGNTGELQFLELAASGTNYVGFKAPDAITSNLIWTLPDADGVNGQFLRTDGAGGLGFATGFSNLIADGRLTLTSADPYPTADVSGATAIYYTPADGNRIALYDGSRWNIRTFSQLSLALGTLTANSNYDVFVYDSSGTPTLELGSAWTDDTTRATALALQDGVLTKSGATTRRYLGTFRTTSATTTEDSQTKRFLWNMYHQRQVELLATDLTDSWNYTTATWRAANSSTANRVEMVIGYNGYLARAEIHATLENSVGGTFVAAGVGVDSTTTNSADVFGSRASNKGATTRAIYQGFPGIGYHYLQWLEISQAAGTTTWFGDGGQPFVLSGMVATLVN